MQVAPPPSKATTVTPPEGQTGAPPSSDTVATHAPPAQPWFAGQLTPPAPAQPPQFWLSLAGSTQVPPQASVPCGQLLAEAQLPATQAWPAPHTTPQPPQFRGSVSVTAQLPPQSAEFRPQPLPELPLVLAPLVLLEVPPVDAAAVLPVLPVLPVPLEPPSVVVRPFELAHAESPERSHRPTTTEGLRQKVHEMVIAPLPLWAVDSITQPGAGTITFAVRGEVGEAG